MNKKFILLSFLMFFQTSVSQIETEKAAPYNIKTISFVQGGQNTIPIFLLGDSFQLIFDDLYGNEANYYYTITHCDYDWKPSQLAINEYIFGLDNQRIIDYTNSFNTLQLYSHYRLNFPNQFTKGFKVSGNYIIKILNDEREIVFSRKFVIYENIVSVPLQIKNPRDVKFLTQKHNLDFTIKAGDFMFQDPIKNVKVLLLQNGIWDSAIKNIKPMFTVGNDLIYRYDKETQFWAGNEFLYFENKDIRNAINNVLKVESGGGIYNTYLMTNQARANQVYTFAPDANGNFVVRNMNTALPETEADYSWVYFSLKAPAYFGKESIYISGMFNNYALIDEYKMEYNPKTELYEKAIIIKQGFTNFQYVLVDGKGKIAYENAIDGNFFQTENDYTALVYYRANNQRYDRIIGRGIANSENIGN